MRDTSVSQALRLLRANGIVTAHREGRVVRYTLADEKRPSCSTCHTPCGVLGQIQGRALDRRRSAFRQRPRAEVMDEAAERHRDRAGDPEYLTVQAINALKRTEVFFFTDKGDDESDPYVCEMRSASGTRTGCDRIVEMVDPARSTAPCRSTRPCGEWHERRG